MSETVITVENLGKAYRLGAQVPGMQNFREAIGASIKAPIRKFRNLASSTEEELYWALRGVGFEVRRGEVLGIIGRNGAGKSTLLKILSRITRPTEGSARLHGRVSSLLEVGTGFHPDLSGRENIYLNGAILGMRRREIDRKFDEIVAFSEVEKFLDTPVKRYSSGMYVRLAFSVAAHLEPDILIVDEVLAVGDAAFQAKCFGKIGDTVREGRTTIFVSHQMPAVQRLCSRVLLFEGGKVVADGDPAATIAAYFQSFEQLGNGADPATLPRRSGLTPVIRRIQICDEQGNEASGIAVGSALAIKIQYEHDRVLDNAHFGIRFLTPMGESVLFLQTRFQVGDLPPLRPDGEVVCAIPTLPLTPGTYYLTIGCAADGRQLDVVERAVTLNVFESDFFGTGRLPSAAETKFLLRAVWTTPNR